MVILPEVTVAAEHERSVLVAELSCAHDVTVALLRKIKTLFLSENTVNYFFKYKCCL